MFEFHLQNWLGADQDAKPVTPELLRMKGVRGLCVYGADETDSSVRHAGSQISCK